MKYRAQVTVKLKDNIKDSKGEAVSSVLKRISLEENANVRIGKIFELEITAKTLEIARCKLQEIIEEVLVNPIIETAEILEFEPLETPDIKKEVQTQ